MKISSNQSEECSAIPTSRRESPTGKPRLSSRLLFGAQSEVVIEHQGEEYRLRITSNGKLILTK